MEKINIIVPIYFAELHQYSTIHTCLDSIYSVADRDTNVIIIDDCSPITDKHIEYAHRMEENIGYTGAVNKGLDLTKGNKIVICNQDIVFTPDLFFRFREMSDAIYSPKTDDEGDGELFGSIWGMTRNVYRKLGKLDERLEHYFSDREYYDRAKRLGVNVVKWYDLVIEHQGSNAYKLRSDRDELYLKDKELYESISGGLYRRTSP